MHRHGYKGLKFNRGTDQRGALIKGLAEALIINGSIETTLPKAKAVLPYTEKLITKAKKNDLHNRRQIISSLQTVASAHKLVDDIAPKLTKRSSGHLRIEKTRLRRGDNAQLAKVEFVDDLSAAPVAQPAAVENAKDDKKAKPLLRRRASTKKPADKNPARESKK